MTFLLQLLAIALVVVLVGLGLLLVDYIRDDGYRRVARRTPPRSHHLDPFDSSSRFA